LTRKRITPSRKTPFLTAFTGDHIKSLGNTIKILDHLLAERSAAKTASAPSSLGNVVDDSAAKAKPDEIHHRPRC
jgi:hypothetical protein